MTVYSSPADTLQLRKVSKAFDLPRERLPVLEEISLDVAPGEFVCIVGASGCGKSTLLRLIAGLDTEYSGSIVYEGQPVTGPDLSRESYFGTPAVSWLTVEQNIQLAFGATSIALSEQKERVQEQISALAWAASRQRGHTRFPVEWHNAPPSLAH